MKHSDIQTEEDICRLISADAWMMDTLTAVRDLHLPDEWVCAGFVRAKVWDALHGYTHRTPLSDVDVIYFHPSDVRESTEKELEGKLRTIRPDVPWSVKNQARMHLLNHQEPYTSSVDAMSKFPETATAIGVRLQDDIRIELAAPWGVHDLVNLIVRPTPLFDDRDSFKGKIYENRIAKKNWQQFWPQISILHLG